MSRIGRLPVKIPKGVKVSLQDGQVLLESSKGKVTQAYAPEVSVKIEGDSVVVARADDSRKAKSLHGLYRNLLKNTLIGLSDGFSKVLLITGVGYKAEIKNKALVLNLGYSTPIEYPIPAGVTMEVDANTKVTVKGADIQQVGQICSEIRSFRPVEPYKGKGIKYENEYVRRKVGKSGIK
ncbi:MAG TPA: 50S ribosomal protein L6 [Spirochaetia bacterium]|nr:50S ribosomal protein L6 [Spirochaetia bacterium]